MRMIRRPKKKNFICQVHEKYLVKENNPHSSDKAATDISGTVNLFPKDKWRKHQEKIQEPKAEAEDMAAEKMAVEKEGKSRKRIKLSAVSNKKKATNVYLILPSYTDQHKTEMNKIIKKEKSKLCSSTFFRNIFENVDFKLAFSNRGNI